MIRYPAVAGKFYTYDPESLQREVSLYLSDTREKVDALAVISPHAGFIYSGHVAGAVYASIITPDSAIILCPNHTGAGADAALMDEGQWLMPMGNVEIDSDIASAISNRTPRLASDVTAHIYEHSLEVQLPFLQYLNPDIRIVPICLGLLTLEECLRLGKAIAETVKNLDQRVLIVASSDMSHYENQESAKLHDSMAIAQIKALKPDGLYNTVRRERISMCGVIPSTVALSAALDLGATRADLVKYATSGDISGDYSSVVGYAGFVIV